MLLQMALPFFLEELGALLPWVPNCWPLGPASRSGPPRTERSPQLEERNGPPIFGRPSHGNWFWVCDPLVMVVGNWCVLVCVCVSLCVRRVSARVHACACA